MKLYQTKLPDSRVTSHGLYDLYVASNLYQALLENAASEQAARMHAMVEASKNAKKVLDELKVKYHRARQA